MKQVINNAPLLCGQELLTDAALIADI